MADKVFVNGRSAIHAGSAGQSTAFPDVNLCPPSPPAGPVPIPLPNVARGADLQGGASSVLIEGNPMAKKSSYLGKSTGNEVAQSTGGGVVSHVVQGKAYFVSYSMDVTIEGEEVPRHLDMLTHNHAAQSPANAAVGTYLATMSPAAIVPARKAPKAKKEALAARSYQMFLRTAPGRMEDHADSFELTSDDGRYKVVMATSAGKRSGTLTTLTFKNLLPGKTYSLTRLVEGDPSHRIPMFERVSYASLLQDAPGPAPPPPTPPPKMPPPPAAKPDPTADPLFRAQNIDVGEDWYWSHHEEDDQT